MRVDHRRNIGMAEQLLHRPNVITVFQQMRRKRMTAAIFLVIPASMLAGLHPRSPALGRSKTRVLARAAGAASRPDSIARTAR
jgi:hypothetical protein